MVTIAGVDRTIVMRWLPRLKAKAKAMTWDTKEKCNGFRKDCF